MVTFHWFHCIHGYNISAMWIWFCSNSQIYILIMHAIRVSNIWSVTANSASLLYLHNLQNCIMPTSEKKKYCKWGNLSYSVLRKLARISSKCYIYLLILSISISICIDLICSFLICSCNMLVFLWCSISCWCPITTLWFDSSSICLQSSNGSNSC